MYGQGQVLIVKEKIGCFPPDEWLILERVEPRKREPYYRIQLNSSKVMRPIGILEQSMLDSAIEDGKVVLGKVRKIKYVKEKGK